MIDPVRALFVDGPLDGRVEMAPDRPFVQAIERSDTSLPVTDDDLLDDDLEVRMVEYRQIPLVDLDGTTIAIYTPDDAMVPRLRGPGPERVPNVTVWSLALALSSARQKIRELEDGLRAATARETWAVRHADALAGTLRDLREEILTATVPTSTDD